MLLAGRKSRCRGASTGGLVALGGGWATGGEEGREMQPRAGPPPRWREAEKGVGSGGGPGVERCGRDGVEIVGCTVPPLSERRLDARSNQQGEGAVRGEQGEEGAEGRRVGSGRGSPCVGARQEV
eukprot:scaffold8271_cov90-Isochrysis_galbana.AAC.1